MNTRKFILSSVFVALSAVPAAAEKLSLDALSKYLNGITTAKSAFTQVNADQTISTGTIYIKRPGRIRFEYNPPEKTLVTASGGAVMIYDPKGNSEPETYPLRRTPLSIVLDKDVNLSRAKMVVAHKADGPLTMVRAQDPEHPEYGSIDLVFSGPNPQLRQWVINDGDGNQTTVILGEMERDAPMKDSLFEQKIKGHLDK